MSRLFKKQQMLLAILTTLIVVSCGSGRPKFDPDAHRANHNLEAIVNERAQVVYCYEPLFSEYACMHKSKWEELRKFVQFLRIDPTQKNLLLKNIDLATKELEP